MIFRRIAASVFTICSCAASLQDAGDQAGPAPPLWESFVGLEPGSQPQKEFMFSGSYKSTEIITPKVLIVSMFALERDVWSVPLGLYAHNVTVPGLSALFPQVHCNKERMICQVVTGEGQINAASTVAALVLSPLFHLQKTYFLVAGVAGVNPACGTIGSVSFARYAVQVGLEYQIDPRELTDNYTSRSGYVPLGSNKPDSYPELLYGSEVYELSKSLRDRALNVVRNAKLDDSATAQEFRKRYPDAPANQPPKIFKGTVTTSDAFWHGANLGSAVAKYVHMLTNGTGSYCTTAQEDNAILESMLRGALAEKVDFARIVIMRTASNFDRPPPGMAAATHLFHTDEGGFAPAVSNTYNAGKLFVDDVVGNWEGLYRDGIPLENYVGDVFGSLKGPFPPDIGRADMYVGMDAAA